MGQMMRAARLHGVGGAGDVRVDEVAVPEPGPGEVLVRVRACGVCASDLHVADGTTPSGPLPQILGHEAAGEVAALGQGVAGVDLGARVALAMGRPCGACESCSGERDGPCVAPAIPGVDSDGAQAEFAVAPADMLVPVPGVDFAQAAILTDAVATPYHALRRAGLDAGMTCAIYGMGGLGMHALLLAKLRGASVIAVDVDEVNLQRALDWGADAVVDGRDGKPHRQVRALSGGGVDRAFEFIGNPATASAAVKSLRTRGRAVFVGLTPALLQLLPVALFVSQELEAVGSFGSTKEELVELADLVASGALDLSRSVTHRLALDEFPAALGALARREGHPVRMVVVYE